MPRRTSSRSSHRPLVGSGRLSRLPRCRTKWAGVIPGRVTAAPLRRSGNRVYSRPRRGDRAPTHCAQFFNSDLWRAASRGASGSAPLFRKGDLAGSKAQVTTGQPETPRLCVHAAQAAAGTRPAASVKSFRTSTWRGTRANARNFAPAPPDDDAATACAAGRLRHSGRPRHRAAITTETLAQTTVRDRSREPRCCGTPSRAESPVSPTHLFEPHAGRSCERRAARGGKSADDRKIAQGSAPRPARVAVLPADEPCASELTFEPGAEPRRPKATAGRVSTRSPIGTGCCSPINRIPTSVGVRRGLTQLTVDPEAREQDVDLDVRGVALARHLERGLPSLTSAAGGAR